MELLFIWVLSMAFTNPQINLEREAPVAEIVYMDETHTLETIS